MPYIRSENTPLVHTLRSKYNIWNIHRKLPSPVSYAILWAFMTEHISLPSYIYHPSASASLATRSDTVVFKFYCFWKSLAPVPG